MTENSNPYQSSEVELADSKLASKRLRVLPHGIYLQLFLGAGFLVLGMLGSDLPPQFESSAFVGVLLIGLGINSLIYVQRFKHSMRAQK